MSASPKSKRAAPARRFEDYTITSEISTSTGLYPISNKDMRYVTNEFDDCSQVGFAPFPGSPFRSFGLAAIDIGFDFELDGAVYRKLIVSATGFTMLVDPTFLEPSHTPLYDSNPYVDAMYDMTASSVKPAWGYIAPYNFCLNDTPTGNHVVLAPWWQPTTTIWRTPFDSYESADPPQTPETYLNSYNISIDEVIHGKKNYPPGMDSTSGGVLYAKRENSNGKFIIIRWNTFSAYDPFALGYGGQASGNILKFDLVIYASGKIEFRYSPKIILPFEGSSYLEAAAAIGIFKNSYQYRDCSTFLEKDSIITNGADRGIFQNGGAIYKEGFTSSNELSSFFGFSSPFTINLDSIENWPGQTTAGAVFHFIPPSNRRQQRRSITTLRDAVSFVRTGGSALFDDQKSLSAAIKQIVEYPSMLPAITKTNNNSSNPIEIVGLYSSGSIQVERTFNPHFADSVLYDSLIEGRNKK